MRRALAILSLASLTLVALAACGDDADTSSTPPPTEPTGRTFISTDVEGEPIPGGGPLTLSFPEPGRITAVAGCNNAVGAVDLADGTLSTEQLALTMRACTGEAAGADAWMQRFLESGPQWTLEENTLTLVGEQSTVTLLDKKIAQPDRPIAGTTWQVTSFISPQATETSVALEAAAPNFTIADDGTLSGSAGCNRMTGRADVTDSVITFEPIATTMMMCDEDTMAVEAAVLGALNGELTATVDGDTMRIQRADGIGLDLRATP